MREPLFREGKSDSGLFQDVNARLNKTSLSSGIWRSAVECAGHRNSRNCKQVSVLIPHTLIMKTLPVTVQQNNSTFERSEIITLYKDCGSVDLQGDSFIHS